MKTKLLSLFTFCSLSLFAQTNLVTNGNLESWTDNTPDNWEVQDNVTQNSTDAAEGNSSAHLILDNEDSEPQILAKVPLQQGVKYIIEYKIKYLTNNFNGAHPITSRIIRQGSATTVSNNSFSFDNEWVSKSFEFTPDQTGDYDLSFSIATFDSQVFEALVDDIKVNSEESLSIDDTVNTNFTLYPTSTSSKVYFKTNEVSADYSISIFDITGKKHNVKVEKDFIDVSKLNTGVYLLNYKSNTTTLTKKFIKI